MKKCDYSIGFIRWNASYLIDGEHMLPWRRFPIIAPTHFTLKMKINKRKKKGRQVGGLLVSLKVHEMHDININATENYSRLWIIQQLRYLYYKFTIQKVCRYFYPRSVLFSYCLLFLFLCIVSYVISTFIIYSEILKQTKSQINSTTTTVYRCLYTPPYVGHV